VDAQDGCSENRPVVPPKNASLNTPVFGDKEPQGFYIIDLWISNREWPEANDLA
jgi:hypothetical protein